MLTIGTRGSTLARMQTQWVEAAIRERFPDAGIRIRIITTSADKDLRTSIRAGSATGVFVKEIEEALLASEIDLAVHSMKDLPTRIPESLQIGAIPAREDAHDALISRDRRLGLEDLPHGSVVGTGSVRRQAQILARRPDLVVKDIRGNVETRLRKLEPGSYDAIVLAVAGLNRLGLRDRISHSLDFRVMLPAPGQGALALELRNGDEPTRKLVAHLHDSATAAAVTAERAFLRCMGGGCNSPVAVHAQVQGGTCTLEGLVATPDGRTVLRETAECELAGISAAAEKLAGKILAAGGAEILRSLH
jgi:hydroxymethylbilane synthase